MRPTLVALAALALAACSLGALDGFAGGTNSADGGGADAAVSDASLVAKPDAASGDADASGPLYADDFETQDGCTPWTPSRATADAVQTSAKGGARACRSCTVGTTGGGIERIVRPPGTGTLMAPGLYTFTVWVRSDAYVGSIAFELYELTATGTRGAYRKTTTSMLRPTWSAMQIVQPIAAPINGFHVELWLDASPPASTCFFVDEASLVWAP